MDWVYNRRGKSSASLGSGMDGQLTDFKNLRSGPCNEQYILRIIPCFCCD